jgi:hypothetical protein
MSKRSDRKPEMSTELSRSPLGTRGVRGAALIAVVAGLSLTVAACSGSSASGSGTPSPAAATNSAGGGGAGSSGGSSGGSAGAAAPGAVGTIAAVSNGSMEVQNPSTGQTTVNFSATTRITAQQTVTLAAVKPGICVTATSGTAFGGGSATPSAGAGAAQAEPRTITASTVIITPATNGSCGARFAGGGPRRSGSGAPSTAPSQLPSGGARAGGFANVVTGQVKAVSGSVITVESVRRPFGASSAMPPTSVTDTVDVTPATTFSETVSATASALVVGKCATAVGKTDTSGAVTATRIAVTDPGAQGCRVGGRFGFGGNGGAATAPTTSAHA